VVEVNRDRSERLWQLFAPLTGHPRVRHARRQGMIFAWDVPNGLPDFSRRYARHALARGVVLRPIGHTIYAMPPYVISDDEARTLCEAALGALEATLAEERDAAPAAEIRDGV